MTHTEATTADLAHLPVLSIEPQDGFNPRKYIGEHELAELTDSVSVNGVIQPIIVRPNPEDGPDYWLVAGERRWRAAKAATLETIPAVVQELDDQQAMAYAVVENTQRDDMSVAEEARAAHRLISNLDGDKNEARNQLGWSQSKFDKRLLLLHACDDVLNALSERKIKIGHAELLAALPDETQAGTLKQVTENNISVADLKAQIDVYSLKLTSAVFDRTDCLNCPHNSDKQAGLFDEAITAGQCLNRACFMGKTQEALEAQREELADEHNAVFLDTEKDSDSYTVLQRTGDEGVGTKQFAACQGCKFFGALISSRPGQRGEVTTGLCFNLKCNAEKVAAHKAETQAVETPKPPTQGAVVSQGQTVQSKVTATASQSTKQTNADPKAVIEQAESAIRQAAGKVAVKDVDAALGLLLASLVSSSHLPSALANGLTGDKTSMLEKAYSMDEQTRSHVRSCVVQHLLGAAETETSNSVFGGSESTRLSRKVINMTGADISQHFVIDEDFVKAHTISGLKALLPDAGFDEWYNRKLDSDKAYEKLMKKKKGDIIDAIFNRGSASAGEAFDFTGYVPDVIKQRLQGK